MMQNNDQHSKKWHWGRIAGFTLLFLIGLILLIQLLFTFWAEPMLKDKTESALAGKQELLAANVENLSLSLFQRQLEIENISLYRKDSLHKSSRQFYIDSLSVPQITVSGIHILPFLFDDELKINSISIKRAFFKGIKLSTSNSAGGRSSKGKKSLYDRIKSSIDALEIDSFSIEGFSSLITDSSAAENKIGTLGNFSLQLSDIRIDSTSPQRKWLPTSNFSGSADSLRWKSSSGLYRFSTENIRFSSRDSLFEVRNFSVNPLLPRYDFSQKVGHETDRINLNIETIELIKTDLPSLIENREVISSRLNITNSTLEIFHNKRLPFGKKQKQTFLHLKFRRLKMPVKIDSAVIDNADITYIEHIKGAPKPGTVTFENTGGTIENLNNRATQNSMTMQASTEVMGTAVMKTNFNFPHNPSGTHYIDGSVGSMDMRELNPVMKYLALAQIESGRIDSINFKIELGPKKSSGRVMMRYQNFSLEMIDFGDKGNIKSDQIKSFLANIFVIDEKNQPPLREGEISFERVQYKSIFNYWWKSLLSGLKSSLGL